MAPIVVDSVIRFTVVGELLNQACLNIIDVAVDTDLPSDRGNAAFDIAGDIINNWDDHIVGSLVGDYTFLRVDWVDLDSLDGTTGSRSTTSDTTLPVSGRATGNACPGHTYAKIRKNLQGAGRRSRRGILRLSGLREDDVSGNNLLSGFVSQLNNDFENFKDGINGGTGTGQNRNLVVVHAPEGGETSFSVISTFQAEPVVGTIRRRMPGYGD